ncbi:MAG: hypothetical protein WAM92_08370, partial [Mycobacterium sp.]
MAEILTDDFALDDRRQVVNAGIRQGRDAEIENVKAMAVGVVDITSAAVATRGERLVLRRLCFSAEDEAPEAFFTELLGVVEINADNQLSAHIVFDLDDFDAAIAELDARYLIGEAAAHARTWSVITKSYAAINRHEPPPTTPDWVNVDHRHETAMGPSDLVAYIGAGLDSNEDVTTYVETVHRLNDVGAVITYAAHEISREGFEAEWRGIAVLAVEGDLINRTELFNEADLDAALARLDQLCPRTRHLENAASQLAERFVALFVTGDLNAIAQIVADDFSQDDRRRVVGAGVRHGRDAVPPDMRAITGIEITDVTTTTVIATRGERLALIRTRFPLRDGGAGGFVTEVLGVAENDANNRTVAHVLFDADDIDAAFEELDKRYLVGEGAPYAWVWQGAMEIADEMNRHQPGAMMTGLAYIDHRRVPFPPGEFGRAVEQLWGLVPNARYRLTTVQALDAHGAVGSLVIEGNDANGSQLQWARTFLFAPGEPRLEVFEEDDVDIALRRFEELRARTRKLENTASRAYDHQKAAFADRDWDALGAILAEEVCHDDRRRVVNSGIRRGRDAVTEEIAGILDIGVKRVTTDTIATRGQNLVLSRAQTWGRDEGPEAFHT